MMLAKTGQIPNISIHAPRAGGDKIVALGHSAAHISIHAPRAGGDGTGRGRRCTRKNISIHAPRAGGDPCRPWASTPLWYFNPRSPCGERRVQRNNGAAYPLYFNPRSPCGERQLWMML